MKTNRCHLTQIFFLSFLFLLFANFVQAETTNCTAITSVPITITTPGIYCLTSDLSTGMTGGFAINIATNNVVIDLNGHKLGGLAAGTGTSATGINAFQRKNITIRNGTVRGFQVGILFGDLSPYTTSQGHLVEDIRADMNTYVGISMNGQGNIIRNNQVVSTGGSALNPYSYGIAAYGPGARVLNNDVIETKEQSGGSAYGIYLDSVSGVVVENNRIGNSSAGNSFGVCVNRGTTVLVSNNRVTTMTHGVYYEPSNAPTGKYRDNLTSGVATPYTGGAGGTDAGNNE